MDFVMDKQALEVFLVEAFPQVASDFDILEVGDPFKVLMNIEEKHLRPGGTVSGPTMFSLADVGMYLAILARLGPVALAVTTNCSIDFMRKPTAGVPLVAEARILKLGRVLVVGDVLIRSQGHDVVVARASMTYSIPPSPVG